MSDPAKDRILLAFRELAVELGLEEISVRHVVARADVARSTFYEHFDGKSDGYRAVLEPILTPFADACTAAADEKPIASILTHIRATSAARKLDERSTRTVFVSVLSALIETRLERMAGRDLNRTGANVHMVAAWIAEAQLGVITAWLEAEVPMEAGAVAALIVRASRSCVEACLLMGER